MQPGPTFRETRLSPEVCRANSTASWTERKRLPRAMCPSSKAPPASSSSWTWAAGGQTADIIWYKDKYKERSIYMFVKRNTLSWDFTLNISQVQFDPQHRIAWVHLRGKWIISNLSFSEWMCRCCQKQDNDLDQHFDSHEVDEADACQVQDEGVEGHGLGLQGEGTGRLRVGRLLAQLNVTGGEVDEAGGSFGGAGAAVAQIKVVLQLELRYGLWRKHREEGHGWSVSQFEYEKVSFLLLVPPEPSCWPRSWASSSSSPCPSGPSSPFLLSPSSPSLRTSSWPESVFPGPVRSTHRHARVNTPAQHIQSKPAEPWPVVNSRHLFDDPLPKHLSICKIERWTVVDYFHPRYWHELWI